MLLHPELFAGKATLASLQHYKGKTCFKELKSMLSLFALDKVEEISAHSLASHTNETDRQ